MKKKNLQVIGSYTAKSGFENETIIIDKFNNWKTDKEAKKWLIIMGYVIDKIDSIKAVKVSNKYKTDIQVQITIYMKKTISAENLSIKLVSHSTGFNQIDKRWIKKYAEMWSIPKDVVKILKLFTGEISPNKKNPRDNRRMFFDEMKKEQQNKVLDFFSKNKFLIISDILKGRGKFSAGWMLVISKSKRKNKWVLKSINHVMNFFAEDSVKITSRGNLKIGRITMQRKGGDAGRKTAKMLQFKINPVKLFD